MKTPKSTFAAFVMMFVLVFGTTIANAGIIIAAKEIRATCESTSKTRINSGIIIAYTGIIIAYTGIIIALKDDTTSSTCGSTTEPTKEVESTRVNSGIIIA